MSIRIDSVSVTHYSIPLKTPFRISAGEIHTKEALIVEMRSGDYVGWGEAAVDAVPFYAHETVGSVLSMYKRALIPLILGETYQNPEVFSDSLEAAYRGNNFAKAALEAAFWDIYGKTLGKSCSELLGGTREIVESGPSIGIKNEPEETVAAIAEQVDGGMRRIKVKVTPGKDLKFLEAIRAKFPDICMMVDANNAYSYKEHLNILQEFDNFNLIMIEQPLYETDLYYHSLLRKQMKTPICLDESIHTIHDTICAIEMQAADIINIKVCRVGGLVNAKRVHDLCQKAGIANWIGSRIGTGIAAAARVAAASMPNCSFPSDAALENHLYMPDDIAEKTLKYKSPCQFYVPESPGLGIVVNRDKLKKYAVANWEFNI